MKRTRVLSGLFLALAVAASSAGRADTVASLLGNFTINQYCGLAPEGGSAAIHYVVIFGQLPALRELHLADANGDGVTSQSERDAYVGRLAPDLAKGLALSIDGIQVPIRAVHWSSSLPTEQGGFSLRIDVDFVAQWPARAADGAHTIEFANRNYAGRIGWHEIVVTAARDWAVFDTNAYSTSLTGGLTEALKSLPATGPLDERAIHLRLAASLPPGTEPIRPRDGQSGSGPPARPPSLMAQGGSAESQWIARRTRQLVQAVSSQQVGPGVLGLALLGALFLGAVHALSPGHGKTVVGAYLIGSRGTPRHALFLGLTVTATHTIGVYVLGFATLYASRYVMPERLFPILSLISAVLVLGMGILLVARRWSAAWHAMSGIAAPPIFQFIGSRPSFAPGAHSIFAPAALPLDATLHSHNGGPMHSHLPPGASGERITWRSLLTLGISGGLVPCPSAMVLLLAAVALNKTAYGMVLVVAFSVGLAATLTLVGVAFLYARNRFRGRTSGAGWAQVLPVLSAGVITLVGIALCVAAAGSFHS